MPKNAYICTMPKAKIKGVVFHRKKYWTRLYCLLPNGKYSQKYYCLDTDSPTIARTRNKEIQENRGEIQRGDIFTPSWRSKSGKSELENFKFQYLTQAFIKSKQVTNTAEKSIDFYRTAFHNLLDIKNHYKTDWCEDLDLTKINDEHYNQIMEYYVMRFNIRKADMSEGKEPHEYNQLGMSGHTIKTRYRNLKTFFSWLKNKGVIDRLPELVINGVYKKKPMYFSDAEMDSICEFIKQSDKYENFLADVYTFYATTGFRKKEPFFVGIGENMVTVKDTKGDAGRGRKVGLDSYQMETLKKLRRRTHTSTIKGERNINSHELDYWSRQFNFVLRDMGIKKGRKFHNLRDTYITKTWLLTGDIFLTSNIVGHTSIAVTQNYSSFLLEEIGHHFPSVVALRNERQAIADAQKQFNLNPWIPQG